MVLLIAALAFSEADPTGSAAATDPVNVPGKWGVSWGPYADPDANSLPVRVIGVTGAHKRGVSITKCEVSNYSGKTASALKFGWQLRSGQESDPVVLAGITPWVGVGELADKERRTIEYPVFVLERDATPVVRDGVLTGHFHVDVLVREIQYEDGSAWKKE
jgi:hypothetical protein